MTPDMIIDRVRDDIISAMTIRAKVAVRFDNYLDDMNRQAEVSGVVTVERETATWDLPFSALFEVDKYGDHSWHFTDRDGGWDGDGDDRGILGWTLWHMAGIAADIKTADKGEGAGTT